MDQLRNRDTAQSDTEVMIIENLALAGLHRVNICRARQCDLAQNSVNTPRELRSSIGLLGVHSLKRIGETDGELLTAVEPLLLVL